MAPVLYVIFILVALVVFVCCFFICVCSFPITIRVWWQSRMRLRRLGGVTTLTQALNYNCSLCQESMETGEKVRTLSCDHAFHCGATAKCENGIDRWLRTGPTTSCPICRQVPQPVPPGKQPPSSSPSTSARDLMEPLLPRAHDGTLPETSSSPPAPQRAQPPRDSEEELPLEQSPQDLEAASPSQ